MTQCFGIVNADLALDQVDRNKNMMVTMFRMSNPNITVMIVVMIVKRKNQEVFLKEGKYKGVGIHLQMIVGQKNPFLILHTRDKQEHKNGYHYHCQSFKNRW